MTKQESTSSRYCACANFQVKQIALTFLSQIFQKMDLGLEISKTNVGIRIISIRSAQGGWSWVKVGAVWVKVGARFSNTQSLHYQR